MDGISPAGPVLAIDHDGLFKELLTTFFVEFLQLFFPKLAHSLDPNSIEFLNQEQIVSLLDGKVYRADIVAKARFKANEAFFVIHVEHQSTAPGDFPRRFFRYFSAIFEKYDLPVYPIVVYSHEAPKKAQPSLFRVDFPDGAVLRFHYRVVQLNRLSWRRFLKARNPVASALMAKMKIGGRDRPRVKAECLRLMLTLKLDPARMRLIAGFVDTYLNLNESEEGLFQRALERANLKPEQKEEVMEIVTSWERRGIEKGFQKGILQGIEKGRIETLREVLLDLLTSRFGALDESVAAKIRETDSADQLRRLTHQALTAASLHELGL
jgi:hypothetical protein